VSTETQSPWRTRWFFICPADRLAEDQSHVAVTLPELAITLENVGGVLSGRVTGETPRPIAVALIEGGVFARIEADGSAPEIGDLAEVGLAEMVERVAIEHRLGIAVAPPAETGTIGNLSIQCWDDFALLGWIVPDGAAAVRARVALYGVADADDPPAEIRALYDKAAEALAGSAGRGVAAGPHAGSVAEYDQHDLLHQHGALQRGLADRHGAR
jgi:hypothetical protein